MRLVTFKQGGLEQTTWGSMGIFWDGDTANKPCDIVNQQGKIDQYTAGKSAINDTSGGRVLKNNEEQLARADQFEGFRISGHARYLIWLEGRTNSTATTIARVQSLLHLLRMLSLMYHWLLFCRFSHGSELEWTISPITGLFCSGLGLVWLYQIKCSCKVCWRLLPHQKLAPATTNRILSEHGGPLETLHHSSACRFSQGNLYFQIFSAPLMPWKAP